MGCGPWPTGSANLTAWTGLLLLVLIAAELVTLLDVRGQGDRSYRQADPPPMILRLLGPLVVVFTLGVLGTGLLLVLVGPDSSRSSTPRRSDHCAPDGARGAVARRRTGRAPLAGSVTVTSRRAPRRHE